MQPRRLSAFAWSLGVSLLLAADFCAQADVRLPALFTDHLVLQIGSPIRIWGWADVGENVYVSCGGNTAKTTTDESGKWYLRLPPCKTGEAFDITVRGKNTLTIKDAVMGEVWLASGQSNMEFALSRADDADKHIAQAGNNQIRLFTVPRQKADAPVEDVKSSWKFCTPETAAKFSAVAYFFARDLQKDRKVPVGIIHASWGGSPAEVWMSDTVLSSNLEYKRDIVEAYPMKVQRARQALEQWEKDAAAAKAEGKDFANRRPSVAWKPSELYNGMIAPLIPYSLKGVIWYQGEANAGRAYQYRTLMADLVRNWRRDFRQGEVAFLQVQLAPYMAIKDQPSESTWAELREAQNLVARQLHDVGVAVITDVGDENDIHPTRKEPVGARLAVAARGLAYNQGITYSGPTFKRMKVKGDEVLLSFDHVGQGLEVHGDELKGFSIAGPDRRFVWAKARIVENKVIVSSPEVTNPVAVRYGWADYPVVNLWNKDGLPASPFRTDDFEMLTQPRIKTIARK
jgi:sialate O-acetylesterase